MGEYILKDLVKKAGLEKDFYIASAGTEDYNIGDPVYPPAREKMNENGVECSGHKARMINRNDYGTFDYIIGMDTQNVRDMVSYWGGDPEGKVHLLLDYTGESRSVADPWYTRNFDIAYEEVHRGCEAFLKAVTGESVE